jgi:sec-independent protein translocase protein TatA
VFGISLPELLIVLAVVLLLFGPDKLPEMARKLGKWSSEFRKASDGLRREFYNSVYAPADLLKNRVQAELSELRIEQNIPESTTPPADSIAPPATAEKKADEQPKS